MYDDDDEGEKQLQLVERERIRVLGEQVAAVVRGAPCHAINVSALTRVFTRYYGCSLKPSQYGSSSTIELMEKLRNHVKVNFALCGFTLLYIHTCMITVVPVFCILHRESLVQKIELVHVK